MIHIFYRQYREDLYSSTSRDPTKIRPPYYSPSLCLFSILDSIKRNGLREYFRVVIWYDGTEQDFSTDPINRITKAFAADIGLFIIRENFRGLGDNSSEKISGPALLQFCTANHPDNDFLYLVENDYLHDVQSMSALKALAESPNKFDYATLYDAPDYYRLKLHKNFHGASSMVGQRSWREVLTTTGTYFSKVSTIKEDLGALLNNSDFYAFVKLVGLRSRVLIAPNYSLASHSMYGQEAMTQSLTSTIQAFHQTYPEGN